MSWTRIDKLELARGGILARSPSFGCFFSLSYLICTLYTNLLRPVRVF
jgi:hypothetical protein